MLDQNSDFYVGVLADGCGGSLGGEIASDLACSTIEAYLIAALSAPESWRSMEKVLRIAFAMANRSIIERAVADPTLQDMASTAVCVVVTGSLVYVAWAGDSRLTVWRTDAIHHVTKDHNRAQTLVDAGIITAEEAMLHPGKSHLTNALGIHEDDDAIPELTTFRIQAGDLLVLSSDGFHEGLTDAATARVCATHLAPPVTADSLRVLARTLESESLAHYGGDNLTAILMHIRSV
jgi:protein phosphatase